MKHGNKASDAGMGGAHQVAVPLPESMCVVLHRESAVPEGWLPECGPLRLGCGAVAIVGATCVDVNPVLLYCTCKITGCSHLY